MSYKPPWVRSWKSIKGRCNSPKNRRYYQRGIKCLITPDELHQLWVRDCGDSLYKPVVDRIDNDGNYEISNCRWIEHAENASRARLTKSRPRSERVPVRSLERLQRFVTKCGGFGSAEKILKINSNIISRWLNGRSKPKGKSLIRLKKFKLTPSIQTD